MAPYMQIDHRQIASYDAGVVKTAMSLETNEMISFYRTADKLPVRLTNVQNPIMDRDAATKEYVDALSKGLNIKESVRVAAGVPSPTVDAVVTATTLADPAYAPGSTVDGVVLFSGDRILLMNQTNPATNGIWVVGSPLVRPMDFDAGTFAAGAYVFVNDGIERHDRSYVCITNHVNSAGETTDVIGTHGLAFTQMAGQIPDMAGNGLVASATEPHTLSINPDNASLYIVDNAVAIKPGGITAEMLAPGAVTASSLGTGSVTSEQLAVGAVTTASIAPGAITAEQLAPGAVDNAALVNDSITVTAGTGLTGGGLTALGGTVRLVVDPTVVPFLSNANTFTGVNTFSNATPSTSQTTGALIVTGGIGITGDVYCSSTYNMSDERLKRDIQRIPDALTVIERMKGCTFEWNELSHHPAGTRTVGVIAQEIHSAGAELCVSCPESGFMAVDYCKIVPYLIESCKELSASVKSLKRRCDDMESAAKRSRVEEDAPEVHDV